MSGLLQNPTTTSQPFLTPFGLGRKRFGSSALTPSSRLRLGTLLVAELLVDC